MPLAPDRYFDMYPETYRSTDYPAIDKRTLFKGKNILVKYMNFSSIEQIGSPIYCIIL